MVGVPSGVAAEEVVVAGVLVVVAAAAGVVVVVAVAAGGLVVVVAGAAAATPAGQRPKTLVASPFPASRRSRVLGTRMACHLMAQGARARVPMHTANRALAASAWPTPRPTIHRSKAMHFLVVRYRCVDASALLTATLLNLSPDV